MTTWLDSEAVILARASLTAYDHARAEGKTAKAFYHLRQAKKRLEAALDALAHEIPVPPEPAEVAP